MLRWRRMDAETDHSPYRLVRIAVSCNIIFPLTSIAGSYQALDFGLLNQGTSADMPFSVKSNGKGPNRARKQLEVDVVIGHHWTCSLRKSYDGGWKKHSASTSLAPEQVVAMNSNDTRVIVCFAAA